MKKALVIGFIMFFFLSAFLLTEGVRAENADTAASNTVTESNTTETAENSGSSVDKNDPPDEETLIIKTGHLNSTDGKIEGTNGMTLVKGSVKINSNHGLYYEDEKRAEIEDNVVLVHEKGEISSEILEAWINDDKYIFEKNVTMLQNLDDGEFTLKSPYLELMKVDNSFEAKQGVVIEYNERTLKGERVLYDDQNQTLELFNNVYIEKENGDWIKSEWALFYLDTEEFTAEGSVELEIDITSK